MKPIAAEIESGMPREARAMMPPTQANGTLMKMISGGRGLPESGEEDRQDQEDDHRNDDSESARRRLKVLVLSAPDEPVTRAGVRTVCVTRA